MVTISITPAALTAIGSTLPKGYKAVPRPDGEGRCLVTLERQVMDRLAAMRGPGESYSDVILRLAKGEGTVQNRPYKSVGPKIPDLADHH